MKNRSKIGSKVDEKNDLQHHRFWERFWVDFGAILGVQNGPKSIKNGIKKITKLSRRQGLVRRPLTGGPGRRGPRWAAPIFAPGLPKN